jgi:hypothetical protein
MRLGLHTGIARASEQAADTPEASTSMQHALATSSSQKEPVPKASHKRRKQKAPESGEFQVVDEETPEQRIQRIAQSKYEEAAATDAAVSLAYADRGKPALTGEALHAKRRVVLTPDAWDELLVRVAEGESVYKVCDDAHMPHRVTFYQAIAREPDKRALLDAAIILQQDKRAEQIVELSATAHHLARMGATPEVIKAIQVQVNSLQWITARLNQRKYGDKQSLDIDQKVTNLTPEQVNGRLAHLVAKAKRIKGDSDGG